MSKSLIFCEWRSEWAIRSKKRAIRSFIMSDLSESLTVAHLSWAIWANHSQSLIWSELMSDEQMSEFPTLVLTDCIENKRLRGSLFYFMNGFVPLLVRISQIFVMLCLCSFAWNDASTIFLFFRRNKERHLCKYITVLLNALPSGEKLRFGQCFVYAPSKKI